jgi:hypothetical protein
MAHRAYRSIDLEVRRIRAELLGLRAEASLRRFLFLYRKYALSQPRIPAGQPGGGRWTDGEGWDDGLVRVAQNGPPRARSGIATTRVTGRTLVGTEGEITELAITRMQADAAVAAVRRVDRNWRPLFRDSLTETVVGETAAERTRLEAAEARLGELGRQDVQGELLKQCLAPNGEPIGRQYRNANSPLVRTVDRETFLEVGSRLLAGAVRTEYNPRYPHPQFLRSDGTVIGVRHSLDSDVTFDVLLGDGAIVGRGFKVHFQGY